MPGVPTIRMGLTSTPITGILYCSDNTRGLPRSSLDMTRFIPFVCNAPNCSSVNDNSVIPALFSYENAELSIVPMGIMGGSKKPICAVSVPRSTGAPPAVCLQMLLARSMINFFRCLSTLKKQVLKDGEYQGSLSAQARG